MGSLDEPTPEHEIIIIPGSHSDLRQQCYDIRIEVFHHEQKFPLETEIDDMEDSSTHFLLRLTSSRTPVGTVRTYRTKNGDYYKLSRLAVLKDYRQYGFGRELVEAAHAWIMQDAIQAGYQEAVRVTSHSQLYVKKFYARFGYEPEGEEFDEDRAPHQRMVMHLALSRKE